METKYADFKILFNLCLIERSRKTIKVRTDRLYCFWGIYTNSEFDASNML